MCKHCFGFADCVEDRMTGNLKEIPQTQSLVTAGCAEKRIAMKILEFSAKLNIGGAQAVAANIARYAEKSMEFTYVVFGDEVGEYEADVIARGNTVVHMPEPKENLWKFFWSIVALMKRERFDVVHAHTMFNCGLIMLAGKIAGVPGRISHSHTISDEAKKSALRQVYLWLMRCLICCFGTEWCACGVDAGNILYGKKWFSRYGTVIKNGIDIDKYQYSDSARSRIRQQYQVTDSYVIGHVGHYVKVKNQAFLIRLMDEVRKVKPNAVLLLLGDGPDRGMLEEQIHQRGLEQNVRLVGNVSNVSEVLSALDVFVFPSLYEGTPLALIEAQANGLTCIISDAVPDDACLTDAVKKLNLEQPESCWVSALVDAKRIDRKETAVAIKKCYGTIETSMEELYSVFRKYAGSEKESP